MGRYFKESITGKYSIAAAHSYITPITVVLISGQPKRIILWRFEQEAASG
jgi:hypothetical protein